MWFCVISVPPPRLAPAARMVCAPAGVAEGKGQRAGQMGQGGLDTVSSGADDGVATPRTPCPGFQGSSQGLVFRATTSLGIFPRGVPRPGDWEQRDSFYWVPVRPTWKVGLALP